LDEDSGRDGQKIGGSDADLVLGEAPGNPLQNLRHLQWLREADLNFRGSELLWVLDGFFRGSRGVGSPSKTTP